LFEEYDAKFAGKPRATRDPEELDDIIDRLERLLHQAREKLNGGRNDTLMSLIEEASENLEIYQNEREAIRELQKGGDGPVRASRLATWANVEFHRYRRHFAGENRATRDVELLNEMISELQAIRSRMEQLNKGEEIEGLDQDIETVEANLDRYREERERILTARAEGTPDERASVLAVAANEQFSIYRELFGGHNRVTRRPALLSRVIRSLEEIRRRMVELRDEEGLDSGENVDNIEIVEDNVSMYREELEAVEAAKEQVDADELTAQLGGAANEVFETYRDDYAGEDRSSRDLERLARMCDELYHLARQMQALDEEQGLESNAENLSVVLENLSLYQREYDAIEDVRGADSVGDSR
ncbi:MAG: hypothetical protein ABEN55_22825, partial [Bradymonadaceae bacterium]